MDKENVFDVIVTCALDDKVMRRPTQPKLKRNVNAGSDNQV